MAINHPTIPNPSIIPYFSPLVEIEVGCAIGKGGFGLVKSIKRFNNACTSALSDDQSIDGGAQSSTSGLSYNISNPKFYALKETRQDLSRSLHQIASIDLAVEAKFLRTLVHPNIVSLHSTGDKPGSKDYFIVIEKLDKALDKAIEDWSNDFNQKFQDRSYAISSEIEGMSRKQQFNENKRALVKDQLEILMGAASALQFLHEQK